MYRLHAFLLMTSISGLYLTVDAFHYPKESTSIQRRTKGYNDSGNCPQSDQLCEYLNEMDHVLEEVTQTNTNPNPEMRIEVDAKLFDLTRQGGGDGECIPYISQYTSCNKDNFCLGCVTCSCDAAGKWSCGETQRCRSDIALDIDHRVLVQIMEKLKDLKHESSLKIKRSVSDPLNLKENKEDFTSTEISSIINGFNDTKHDDVILVNDNVLDNDLNDATDSMESMNISTTERNNSLKDSDLEFDDLFLRNNSISGKHTKFYLPMLKKHIEDILDPDYMNTPDDNSTQNEGKGTENISQNKTKFLKEEILNNSKREAKKMIFYANFNKDISVLSYMDKNVKGYLVPGESNDIYERVSVRVVKRQADNTTNNAQTKISINSSRHSVQDLKDNVFLPLNSIISTKLNEIKELEKIRDNLKNYLNLYIRNESLFNTKQYNIENITKSYLTMYKVELKSTKEDDLLTNKALTSLDYLSKLQNDIYVVIEDIVEMQRNSVNKDLPEDLNLLVESMKYYVHNQGRMHIEDEIKKITENKRNNYRKSNLNAKQSATDTVKDILVIIDKDMPRSDALAPLSVAAKKIMKRIVHKNYNEGLSEHDFFNVQYNVTEQLKDTGIKWYKMTRRIASSGLSDRLTAMKLLHLELSRDILNMKHISAFIDFVQIRRFIVTDWEAIDRHVTRIGEDLKIITKKILEVIKVQNYMIQRNTYHTTEATLKLSRKNGSFLKKIKNLLKQSKAYTGNIFKSKHLDNQYVSSDKPLKYAEDTKWRNILYGNINRNKRSVMEFKKTMRKIKNIIPNYLRDKFGSDKNSKPSKKKL